MKLLSDELRAQLPALYAQEKEKNRLHFTPKHRIEIKEIEF